MFGGVGGKKASGRNLGLPGLLTRFTSKAWERDADIETRRRSSSAEAGKWLPFLALTFSGIGVVYGDIGTSFIYVFPSVFTDTPSEDDIIGAVSLVIWTITTLVLVKYALLVLRADDNGQGGAFALFSLLKRQAELGHGSKSLDRSLSQYSAYPKRSSGVAVASDSYKQRFIESPWTQKVLTLLVCVGVGAIMGDGVLTPSVSVVSACEGILVRWPQVSRGVIDGIAIAIIVVLFAVQRYGTGMVGYVFSPVVTLWLLSNAVIGVYNIASYHPGIFIAFSPQKWFSYFLRGGTASWRSLGGVLLCVTGCEALFADLGHFSRKSIQASFIFVCWPCLILTYLGQAAYLIKHPADWSTSFWSSLPNGTFFPMFVLATLASIIASQALISAAFQIVKQAIAQGFFPRFTIIHTSKKVYIPFICYLLGGLCVLLVATFQTSARLTRAYGLAVLVDMLITTHFFTMVHVVFPIIFYVVFATIETTFLSATAEKIPTGGWFSLMMSAIYTSIMLLWFWGSRHKAKYFSRHATNLSKLLQVKGGDRDHTDRENASPSFSIMGQTPCSRLPGAALWYSDVLKGAPPTLERHLTRFPALHAVNVVFTVRYVPVPEVFDEERFLVKALPLPGFYHVIARYGYGERVQQDESFADMILQRICMLQYGTLHALVSKSSKLRSILPHLPAMYDVTAQPEHGIPSIKEHESLNLGKHPLVPHLSAPSNGFGIKEFTAIDITGDVGAALEHRSAPVGSVAVAYPAGKARRSAHLHGFTDESFRPAFQPDSEGVLDATSAAALASWAAQVATGEVVVEDGNEAVEEVVREIAALWAAKEHSVTYVVGSTQARASEKASVLKKYLVHEPFLFLVHNFTSNADLAFGIPLGKLAIVGLPYHLD